MTEKEIKEKIKAVIPKNWRISNVNSNTYPDGYYQTGEAGFELTLNGQPREMKVTFQDDKSHFSEFKQEVSPHYKIWCMPENYVGSFNQADADKLQVSWQGQWPSYLELGKGWKFYLRYESGYPPLPEPKDLKRVELEEKLKTVFSL